MPLRSSVVPVALALLLTSCGAIEASPSLPVDDQLIRLATTTTTSTTTTTTTTTSTTTTVPATTTTEPPRVCEPTPLTEDIPRGSDARHVTLHLTRSIHGCVDHLVVSDPEPNRARAASRLALAEAGALLVTDAEPTEEQVEEIRRLEPQMVTSFGVAVPEGPWALDRADPTAGTDPPALPDAGDDVWLVRGGEDLGTVVAPAAAATGAAVLPVKAADPRALGVAQKAMLAGARSVRMVGDHSDSAAWQLEVVRAGTELPGGGQLMFPGRRLVAFYGSPRTDSLGVLGERSPAESLAALQEMAPDYASEGVEVLPTFELIATVAGRAPGEDGNYSEELPVDGLRPWVDLAAEEGAYVVLDLQPGRSDFLTQAKRYEELLRLPHVGLALDPEWRLDPDEVHLDQIGTVTAEEINSVVGWLAQLVREERIPQKLLVIHQFKFTMITEREAIRTPSELAVVIHMDGQGPLATKFSTYRALVTGTEKAGWWWGWKSFFDEDSPMATPEEVLTREPAPVFVSFQ